MGLLSIGGIGPMDNGRSKVEQTGKIDLEKLNTIWNNRVSQQSEAVDASNADSYADFNSAIKQSPIKGKLINQTDLEKLGYTLKGIDGKWMESSVPGIMQMDKSGATYYENKKTGEEISINNNGLYTSVVYTKGNIVHEQRFDKTRKPKGGEVILKNKDGSSVEYHYENDINGNKFLTGVKKKEAENKAPKDFDSALKVSTLGAKFQTPEDLEAQGWVKEPIMDKNGGIYYKNPETGATIRVMESRIFGEGKTLTLNTDNMSHFVEYDDNGKETGGIVQVKQDDGSIKVYEYAVDINGNKFIKSEEISHQDYFSAYE